MADTKAGQASDGMRRPLYGELANIRPDCLEDIGANRRNVVLATQSPARLASDREFANSMASLLNYDDRTGLQVAA